MSPKVVAMMVGVEPTDSEARSREGKALATEREARFFSDLVVVRQNQPIRLDRLAFICRLCLGLLFAGVSDLLGADEDAVGPGFYLFRAGPVRQVIRSVGFHSEMLAHYEGWSA
jgi:hypothetical protein